MLGEGREAHPGSAGQCTQRPRDRVVAGPGSGPRAAQAPPDTALHHPRSRRGTRSAVCSGQQSRWAPFRDWGSRSSGGPRPAAWLCPPAHRSSAQAVSVLAAAPAVAILTGVAGPAAPAITLVVGQAGAGDHCAYLAAVGMLAAPATPMLAQVYHWRQRESGWTRRQEGRGVGPPTSHSCSPVHVRPSPS